MCTSGNQAPRYTMRATGTFEGFVDAAWVKCLPVEKLSAVAKMGREMHVQISIAPETFLGFLGRLPTGFGFLN